MTGGLDTGIDFGKFIIDTSNNIGQTSPSSERYADRFIGPYARTHLNSSELVTPDDPSTTSEQRSSYLLGQYFKLINTHMHGLPGGKVESESFSHDFRLPKCYDIPKFKEMTQSGESVQLISSARCKQFPDKVLFYIFYNMPHDKA